MVGLRWCTAPVYSCLPKFRSWSQFPLRIRTEAFDAARFGIDAIKAGVPIWKRETWDGGSAWGLDAHPVDGSGVPHLSEDRSREPVRELRTTWACSCLMAAVKAGHTSVQWWTLAWIAGAAVAAAVTIAIIVVVSRRPKSMEDGMAEFSRSLQAVAPAHRSAPRPGPRAGRVPAQQKHKKNAPSRATRGETEGV